MAYRVAVGETESKITSLSAERVRLHAELELARRTHGQLVQRAARERERDRRWAEARLRVVTENLARERASEREHARRDADRMRVEQISLREELARLRELAHQLEGEVWMLSEDRATALLHYRARLRLPISELERERIERILERLTRAGE